MDLYAIRGFLRTIGAVIRRPSSAANLFFMLAGLVVLVDQTTKTVALRLLEEGPVEVFGNFFRLVLVHNPGAGFSLGADHTWLLTIISAGAVVAISTYALRRTSSLSMFEISLAALLVGGASGNLVDRLFRSPGLFRGHVVDFLDIASWPTFNVADSAVVCAVTLFVVRALRN
jgi:signal peptidase II